MPGPDEAEAALGVALVRFGRLLRRRGVRVSPDQVIRYQHAVGRLDPADLEDLYWAGRACLVTGRPDVEVYDRAFGEHFLGRDAGQDDAPVQQGPEEGAAPEGGGAPPAGPRDAPRDRLQSGDEDGTERSEQATVGETASSFELLRAKSFPALTEQEQAMLYQLLRTLRPDLPMRTTRRTRPARRGTRLDLRRSVRRSLRTQGELVTRHWRRRRTEPRTIVLVLDVSGSMASYSHAMLQFAYGLSRSGMPVEVFCFGTRLTRVTGALRARDPDVALERAAAAVVDWDGGTRIGASIKELLDRYSQHASLRGSVVVLCSDGLDRGDPELLAAQMARLGRLAHRVVWVNPLKGSPRYQPLARGMAAALPHIDVFVPGHNVASLEALGEILGQRV